ncbi:MAG: ATP-binding protein [Armatimonadota bacterium]|nr:ATP-binding protein [Armatimonadota bacterium]
MLRRSLGAKVFASYLIVIAVGTVVLIGSANIVAPRQFARRMQSMDDFTPGLGPGGPGPGMGRRGAGPPASNLERLYRYGLINALWVSGVVAILVAGALSVFVTRRIMRPVQAMAVASHRIAEGHYRERVPVQGTDELAELAESFNTMASALEQIEARRRVLLADVVHELRTPLSGIKGYMEGLTDGVVPPEPEVFSRIAADVDRLQRLVTDLEELSRLDAGVLTLKRQRVRPAALVDAAIDRLRPQAEDKGLILTADLPDGLPDVDVDHDRILQVMLNLIGNAIQYTPAPGRVSVSARAVGSWVQLDVTDTGIGIAAEHLPHVFERFYRVDRSRARAGGGSGLGLTIARYLVEAHGGRIWASSAGPGQGSTFSFTLPTA